MIFICATLLGQPTPAAVDTLKGTANIEETIIYSWEDCNPEVSGEDCRRYNAGNVVNIGCGNTGPSYERRLLFMTPGWDETIPDSSELKLYSHLEIDTTDRDIFLYPLTTRFYEGNENAYNRGDYPNPDSGATWNHAYLDVGDGDSTDWSSAGGDYTTGIACTTTVTGTGVYFSFRNFNRILNYWDTSGKNYGFILINENVFPSNISQKTFKSSEGDSIPLVLLYTAGGGGDGVNPRRRRIIKPSGR